MKYDVAVVGAGPAGSAVARSLSKSGLRVVLLEEHERVGRPVHCSGLVTPRTLDVAGVGQDMVLGQVKGAVIWTAGIPMLRIGNHRLQALIIDREALDVALVHSAQEAGAELVLGARVVGVERVNGSVRLHLNRKKGTAQHVDSQLVIGADGSRSILSQYVNGKQKASGVLAVGGEALIPREDTQSVEIFVGPDLAPGWFGWIIPIDHNLARIGIGTTAPGLNPRRLLETGMLSTPRFKGARILRLQGGIIPTNLPHRMYASHILLVGDAAGQVKPTSGGGIYTSLVAAKECAAFSLAAFERGTLDAQGLAEYQRMWLRNHGEDFRSGRLLHQLFTSLSARDLRGILGVLHSHELQEIICQHGDIDFPSHLFNRLLTLQNILGAAMHLHPWTILKLAYYLARWKLHSRWV